MVGGPRRRTGDNPAEAADRGRVNVTITGPTAPSHLTVWPDGAPQPLASDLDWNAGQTVPNVTVVGLGPDGKVEIVSPCGYADVIFDVVGYYS